MAFSQAAADVYSAMDFSAEHDRRRPYSACNEAELKQPKQSRPEKKSKNSISLRSNLPMAIPDFDLGVA